MYNHFSFQSKTFFNSIKVTTKTSFLKRCPIRE